jgi:hypothetical protein
MGRALHVFFSIRQAGLQAGISESSHAGEQALYASNGPRLPLTCHIDPDDSQQEISS